jgi:hypothetical protein
MINHKNFPLLILLCVTFLILQGLYLINTDYFKEDHLVENAQAIILLVTSLSALRRSRQPGWNHYRFFFIVAGIGFLFVFLEEINYGQRIFHIQNPAFFLKLNDSQEMNFHNIKPDGLVEGIGGMMFLLYALSGVFHRPPFGIKWIPGPTRENAWILIGILCLSAIASLLYWLKIVGDFYFELVEILYYLYFLVLLNIHPQYW